MLIWRSEALPGLVEVLSDLIEALSGLIGHGEYAPLPCRNW